MNSGPDAAPAAGYIGARLNRVEDPRLLTGRGQYVADITLPRLKHVAFVRALHSHARIVSIDTEQARAMPGVVAVLTAADLPDATMIDGNFIPGLAKTPQPALARDKVRFVGEAVAVVVADSRYLAEDAAELVQVEYEPLPAVVTACEQPAGHVPIIDELPDDIIYDRGETFGRPEQAFRRARHVFVKDFAMGRSTASPMECRGAVARFDPAGDSLEFWCSTQSPHLLRRRLSVATGVPEHHVRVYMHDVGGGFGQKIAAQPEEIALALVSVQLGLAVKWIEDRREHLMAAPHARGQSIRLELATDDAGTFLGMRASIVGDAGAYSFNAASALIEPYISARAMPGVYRVENYEYHVRTGLTNKSPVAPYRGVGFVAAQTARELLIDEAARGLGMDRIELRRKNMVRPEEFPYRSCTGLVYDSGSYLETLDTVCELAGYESLSAAKEQAARNGRLLGFGVSPYVEPTGWGTEGMNQMGWHSFPSNDSARVSMDLAGKMTVAVGTGSQGQGIETTLAQVAADVVGISIDDVTVMFSDTSANPISLAGTRASRTAVVSGGAVGLAAEDVRNRILKVAGMLLEVDPAALQIGGGMITSSAVPTISMSVAEVVQKAFQMTEIRTVEPEPNFTSTRFYDPKATYSNACIGVLVEIDPATAEVRVLRIVGAEDCGTVINPLIVDGQFAGGIVQGLGGALLERLAYDENGEILTTTFMDYLLPTAGEVPAIEISHASSPSPHTWHGIKGVGESGVVGAPAAVAGAVADALAGHGHPGVSRLPLLPEEVWRLLSAAGPEADQLDTPATSSAAAE